MHIDEFFSSPPYASAGPVSKPFDAIVPAHDGLEDVFSSGHEDDERNGSKRSSMISLMWTCHCLDPGIVVKQILQMPETKIL